MQMIFESGAYKVIQNEYPEILQSYNSSWSLTQRRVTKKEPVPRSSSSTEV